MNDFDTIVIGGGMVGAASALGLARMGQKVLVVEASPPAEYSAEQAIDLRVSALSHASISLLQRLDAWESIDAMRHAPYSTLEAWEDPAQVLSFNAKDAGLDTLGSIVENRIIQLGIWQQFKRYKVTTLSSESAQLEQLSTDNCQLNIDDQHYSAERLIVADGANSKMRQQLGIGVNGWNYRQHCFAINIELRAEQQEKTWQQFCPSGPRALLPLPNHQACLIWYDSSLVINQLKNLSSSALEQTIVEQFPALPGEFNVLSSASFPLTRMHANQYVKQCAVLVGDAAHTIHPMAGQGVNLGFKDVEALLETQAEKRESGNNEDLIRYQGVRRRDNLLMQTMMDGFYLGFSNNNPLLKGARKLGLKTARKSGPLKTVALRYALGIA